LLGLAKPKKRSKILTFTYYQSKKLFTVDLTYRWLLIKISQRIHGRKSRLFMILNWNFKFLIKYKYKTTIINNKIVYSYHRL